MTVKDLKEFIAELNGKDQSSYRLEFDGIVIPFSASWPTAHDNS